MKNLIQSVVLLSLILVFGSGCLRVSSDTQSLRDAVLSGNADDWEEKIELSLGRMTFGLAQLGATCVELPPEARALVNSAKGAEVGVYEFKGSNHGKDNAAIMVRADKAMAEEGWERMVAVASERDLVLIYIPQNNMSSSNVKVTVLVLNEKQMICVAARSNLEPLLQIALQKVKDEGMLSEKAVALR